MTFQSGETLFNMADSRTATTTAGPRRTLFLIEFLLRSLTLLKLQTLLAIAPTPSRSASPRFIALPGQHPEDETALRTLRRAPRPPGRGTGVRGHRA